MTIKHRAEKSALWYRVFRYRWLEWQTAARPDVKRILDLGCGSGENMWRFVEWARMPLGLDVAHRRLQRARVWGAVVQGEATTLPFAHHSLDMVYAAHLLHHVAGYEALLDEARRCLRWGGVLFLVETVEDHPLVRLGRRWHPRWGGDAVATRLYAGQLIEAVKVAGFEVIETGQYGALFWIWEMLPERVPCLDRLTPLFLVLELWLHRVAERWGAHCYCLAASSMPEGVSSEQYGSTSIGGKSYARSS